MPKDLIHFKVAERTARLLNDTKFAASLDACPHGLLLGSVFHDALFYGVTKTALPLEKLAHKLHGANGEDTFTLLRLQADHASATKSPLAKALLVGMTSHIFADAVMHPMVWHFTGDYYETRDKARTSARQRHRTLESLMDMVACPEMLSRSRYSLRLMLRRTPGLADALPLTELSRLADIPEKQTRSGLHHAWTIYSTFQRLYTTTALARPLYSISPWLPRHLAEISALFYAPQILKHKARLEGDIEFVHPVTGTRRVISLEQLMDEAATGASEICRALLPSVKGDARSELPETGPSMDAGLTATPTSTMTHYANPPFPDLP